MTSNACIPHPAVKTPHDKVVLLAPVAPFRGGIARHSTALAEAFAEMEDVIVAIESFSLLYPRFLYPGASDRDPDGASGKVPARYAISSINPISWFRAIRRIAALRPSLVVIPAWTFFVAPMLGTIARGLRRRGICVAAIVHNVGDHEGGRWKSRLCNWQLRAADFHVTHNEALAEQVRRTELGRPILVCPHPVYADYPSASGNLPREYGLELLCFGFVRPYKGVDVAIRALGVLADRDVRLTVAGEVWGDIGELRQLATDCGVAERVEFLPHYIPDQRVADLFARADAVVAPYRSVTGSGVLALAAHYCRPVVASDLPGLAEAIDHRRNGWLFPAADEAALADLLAREVTRDRAAGLAAVMAADKGGKNWAEFARTVLHGSIL